MIATKIIRAETKALGTGRVEAVVSTEDEDRDGDIIRASGWRLDKFLQHPVLLASHDYLDLRAQIGEWESMEVRGKRLVGVARYYVGEGNAEADWAYNLASKGRAAYSVGFIPLEWKERPSKNGEWPGHEFVEQELLEVSHVSIPSNSQALQLMAKSYGIMAGLAAETLAEMKVGRVMSQANLDRLHGVMDTLDGIHDAVCDMVDGCPRRKGITITIKAIPADVSRRLADEGEVWEAPNLMDFTDEPWGDLSDAERRRIAGHFAWARAMPPETYGDLKLPHHRPSDGAVVWRGVAAGMGVLLGARGGVDIPDGDREAVHGHLASHYRQWDREPPELRSIEPKEIIASTQDLSPAAESKLLARILSIETFEED